MFYRAGSSASAFPASSLIGAGKQLLPLCQQLLGDRPQQRSETPGSYQTNPPAGWHCPHCGGAMLLIEKLTAQQIRSRCVERNNLVDSS